MQRTIRGIEKPVDTPYQKARRIHSRPGYQSGAKAQEPAPGPSIRVTERLTRLSCLIP